ncbi:dipeptidase PepV [Viridibacillus sp. YIM B01967]|uniref:Dipeptidase PepV n=1 Tax=Viridibacillus soli TaxID=2798301 RepID=A0ABS1H9H2_9BACL|nr:dipeptidase PepV [Viridibacillus soli]MBK3496067.1 dipeptidase PepV [Viridibacillus soli]
MNWLKQAEARQDELIKELQELVQIESVLDEATISEDAPFGVGPLKAMKWLLQKGEDQGLVTKNIDNMAGHIEMGSGEELVGILCHVDVVPAGSDWVHPPFGGAVEDGKLFGRGAIDDKGPTMAAWLAMKMVKDAGIQLDRRVRLIIGSDEETGFRCVNRYFEKEEMPTLGFAPDADFPIINAEKGIAVLVFSQQQKSSKNEQLISLKAGRRTNMVPDFAEAMIQNVSADFELAFHAYLQNENLQGVIEKAGDVFTVSVKGKSAHAMEPDAGVNAAVKLAAFLNTVLTSPQSKEFVQFLVTAFGEETRGHALGLAFNDDMSGDTTFNAGVIEFTAGKGGEVQVSMRYSVTYPYDEKITAVQENLAKAGFALDIPENSEPHYVDEKEELIQKLFKVYERNTGEKAELLSIGGGTYARELKTGVAFGMLFPGEPDIAHQADEFVVVENLVKAAAIYADAIVELATK